MSIPEKCTVLVVGGGPGGSYAAAALAREGVDTVLLEAVPFPRYHVGESMLASIRHLLRFIDLDSVFDKHGFTKKVGAAFKLHPEQREGYTDFLAAGGPNNYAWNVVRSEADDLLFQHARKSGASAYDGVKVEGLNFSIAGVDDSGADITKNFTNPGRPVSASYVRRIGNEAATISFEYLIDATGRAGLLSSKYLKNRRYNQGLKNIATWTYWEGVNPYAEGTSRANSPYFEALRDGSGWAWLIPLHNRTTSVGVVMNQEIATAKRKDVASPIEFYLSSIDLAPTVKGLLSMGKVVSEIQSASDFSYSSSSYAGPYYRIIGDAGCFIDPYFSSGVHLAMVSALSAATTICAAIKGDCEESVAARWHSNKVADGYTRFLLVVLSAYKQIHSQNEPILSDLGEDNLDQAFARFRPIIQGSADISCGVPQAELSETIRFCANAWDGTKPDARASILEKIRRAIDSISGSSSEEDHQAKIEAMKSNLSEEEKRVLDYVRARQLLRTEDSMHIENFSTDVINGLAPYVHRGHLTLRTAEPMAVVGLDTRQRIG